MYLQHPDRPDLSWEILSYDKTTNIAVLRGRFATIEVDFDMAAFKAKGYTITKGSSNAFQPRIQT